jgi:hypothetical protein
MYKWQNMVVDAEERGDIAGVANLLNVGFMTVVDISALNYN